ncbi:MAG: OmpA family protein [Deltaproteobacteria bacterium]|nr:OmpA family protein [Deltaproteobacteria bacterium]
MPLLILTILIWGCASAPPPKRPVEIRPVTQVILLPNPDGKVGSLEVASEEGAQLLSRPWQSTESSGKAMPSAPQVLDETEVRRLFADALEAEPLPPVSFIIYFKSDSATLSKDALAVLNEVNIAIGKRKSTDIIVSGHTDAVGAADYNRTLSLKRAKAVADALASKGVDRQSIAITYHGKGNPLLPTPDNVPEPKNRRVEITVR